MAMRIRRYGAEFIAQYGRSRATLDATGLRHRASICPVSPRRTPWSSIWKLSCGVVKSLFEASIQKAQNGPYSAHRATSCVEIGGPQFRFPTVIFGIERTNGLKFHVTCCFDSRESKSLVTSPPPPWRCTLPPPCTLYPPLARRNQ